MQIKLIAVSTAIKWSLSLVFSRKDLCEANPKYKVCLNFQISFLHLTQMDPLLEAPSDQEWNFVRSP